MNNLMVFENHNIEVFEFNGQVLFNPYHVGECLGIKDSAVRMAIQKMNNNQVVKLKSGSVNSIDNLVIPTSGKNFLTESGVYKLIFKSRKKEAEKFADW
ncbi:Bro-N domain-containing protein, partial [Filifactor alocis]|uniref:BRO-N domain-containing protein n=1 Tax=Filifactor alocis TaxID=143361 RepID=UPI0028E6B6B9